jgi:hypothetical protein
MITCVIKIVENPGKGFMVDMIPDQSNATAAEMQIAGIIDYIMQPVFDAIVSSTGRGEMIESKDAEAVRQMIEEKTKRFFSKPEDGIDSP